MGDRTVYIEYANMAKMNKIRAIARKHGAIVNVSRYARDAYEGKVTIPYRWNRGRLEDDAIVAAIEAVIKS
jgi:hypothetical protein